MAFIDELHSFESGLVRRMRTSFDQARTMAGKRRVYNATFNELNNLSDRDLADLGISRPNIRDVAYRAAFKG